MADLWQQFHSLPKAIRDGVATPQAIAAVDELEQQHPGIELANFVMRVVVHEFPLSELPAKISSECSVDSATASSIADRLRAEVFVGDIAAYLGVSTPAPAVQTPSATPQPSAPPKPPVNLPVVSAVPPAVSPMKPIVTPPPAPVQAKPAAPIKPGMETISSTPKPAPPITPPPKPSIGVPPIAVVPPIPLPAVPQPTRPIGTTAPTTQYSDEDAVEIERQASKLRTLTSTNPNQDLDTLARQILTDQNVASSDELLDRRSVSMIKARLKGLRTTEETAEMMTRDPKIGGLGFDKEIALNLARAAEKQAALLKERGMVRPPEIIAPPVPPPVPSVAQQKPAPMPPLRRDTPTMAPVPVTNFTEAPRASRPIIRPADIPQPTPMTPPPAAPMPVSKPVQPIIQRARGTDRPTVSDVVRPQVALGPAEELRSMTLIEFRRLGQGAGDAARRLLDKFNHLQRESFAVWAEAVAGWRQSDVYQLYLTMGRESMESGQPISQIIADRGRTGQPYLSEHEFTVLSDLNRQLQN